MLVEACYALTTKLFKKDIARAMAKKDNAKGCFDIILDKQKLLADYWFEYENHDTYLVINYESGNLPQKILLTIQELTFGTRAYFTCECGYVASSLYIRPNSLQMRCRRCHNLRYEVNSFNKGTIHGKALYQLSRRIKIMNIRESIDRPFYKGDYCGRFKRFLELAKRAGLNDVVEDAAKLLEFVKAK